MTRARIDTLYEAYGRGQKLVDRILQHVRCHDANEWKVIVSNDEDDAQLVIRFTVSYQFGTKRKAKTADQNPI